MKRYGGKRWSFQPEVDILPSRLAPGTFITSSGAILFDPPTLSPYETPQLPDSTVMIVVGDPTPNEGNYTDPTTGKPIEPYMLPSVPNVSMQLVLLKDVDTVATEY